VQVAVWHNLPSGGGKRALYDHVRGLAARGHRIEAWCPSSADTGFLPLAEFVPEHVVPFTWAGSRPNNALTRLVSDYRDMDSRIRAMDEVCRACAEQINAGGFDVLFANACQFFRVTPIARYVRIPKILYLQEPYRWLYEAMPQLPWAALPPPAGRRPSASYWKRVARDLVRVQALRVQVREELANAKAFDTILVNSLFSRESVLRAYGLDAKVCYLGVDTDHFVSRAQPREEFLVGVGAFVPEKNIPFVIEAVARVPEPRPSLVWIGNVGSAPYVEELRQLASSLGVTFEPRVRIDDTELLDLLNRARIMVYAPRLEPFGYAPLEASACELPVVGVAEGGLRETVIDGENGLLVEHAPEALAQAIVRLRSDESYARRLGNNGRQLAVERWRLDGAIDRLEARLLAAVHNPPDSTAGSRPDTSAAGDRLERRPAHAAAT
jgi:glycosyltransferase involved in cell wall biosynthesis